MACSRFLAANPSSLLAIGEIASETRIGGKRRFDPNTGGKESFIRRAHEVGFSLDEMRTRSTTNAADGEVSSTTRSMNSLNAGIDST